MIRRIPNKAAQRASRTVRMIPQSVRVVWRLLRDERVPLGAKLVPVALLALLVFPPEIELDLIFPILGIIGAIVIVAIALKLIIWMSPYDVVREHTERVERDQ
jgi:uncharacterized membrane protein YkvA (DUF1232 family)